ncbi:hypothetical protein SAMN05421812_10873 [Asanoa hainanensis]|uniref:TIGR01777 family protein n=1 Tax=Asanoa hainanensis TaxID=560556 RepID=A0A239NAW8_9ACTN|nr:TIGR01777 family oxidoreductase [Asanoa hainanensis]SNT51900.1 hypothetical protein SAMN05421812_10873 [Asanoa hainanensis]
MRILLAGASGFLGNRLITGPLRGHEIVRLVRRAPRGADEIRWTPASGQLDPAALDGVDAVINLSGANIGDQRWTPAYRRLLRDSRVEPTRTLAEAISKRTDQRPKTFLSASGINIYGDTGDRVVDESDTPGEGFFPDLCRVWEASTRPAEEAGVRVVLLRSGVPLEKNEGFLKPQMLPFRLGIGGPIAGGRQWVPWISLDDWLRAVGFLLTERTDIAGPVNLCSPLPVTNAEFTKAFGAALHRPAVLPVPEFGVRLVVGGVAELAVMSTRAVPGVLSRAGFTFRHPDVRSALAEALADR